MPIKWWAVPIPEECCCNVPVESYWSKLVRLHFNPSQSVQVWLTKERMADIIDNLHSTWLATTDIDEKRVLEIAMQQVENACMRAVKAFTFNEK